MFIGVGHFSWASMGITAGFAAFVLFVGVLIFNQTEKNFMDTV
jgi:lipopolysaccharide transport system permease protein